MEFRVDEEFVSICRAISAEGKSVEEWAEIESDDMFSTAHYEGGFDADEGEFCFSLYKGGREYWFQVSLDAVNRVTRDGTGVIVLRPADA